MKIQALSTAVHDFIGDGKTENALALLKQEIPSVYPKGMIDVTMLKSRYIQAHDDFAIRGVISSTDFDARVSQINLSILEFLERMTHFEEIGSSSPKAATNPQVISSVSKKVKPLLKISTPGLVILFTKKGIMGMGSVIFIVLAIWHTYFVPKTKVAPVIIEQKPQLPPSDTLLLQTKLKAFKKEEAEEARTAKEKRVERRKNAQSKLGKTPQRSGHEVKKPSTYSNEMDTIKPLYAPAPKKIIFPAKPDGVKHKGA